MAVSFFQVAFSRLAGKAELGSAAHGRLTPHSVRHTPPTWARRENVPLDRIAAVLGHADLRMTLRTYANIRPDDLAASLDVLASVERRAREGTGEEKAALWCAGDPSNREDSLLFARAFNFGGLAVVVDGDQELVRIKEAEVEKGVNSTILQESVSEGPRSHDPLRQCVEGLENQPQRVHDLLLILNGSGGQRRELPYRDPSGHRDPAMSLVKKDSACIAAQHSVQSWLVLRG
jgi:hypothetical protein